MYTSVFLLRKVRSQQETITTFQVNFKLQPEHKSEVNEENPNQNPLLLNFFLYIQAAGFKEEECLDSGILGFT